MSMPILGYPLFSRIPISTVTTTTTFFTNTSSIPTAQNHYTIAVSTTVALCQMAWSLVYELLHLPAAAITSLNPSMTQLCISNDWHSTNSCNSAQIPTSGVLPIRCLLNNLSRVAWDSLCKGSHSGEARHPIRRSNLVCLLERCHPVWRILAVDPHMRRLSSLVCLAVPQDPNSPR